MIDPIPARSQDGRRWARLQSLLTLDSIAPLCKLMGLPLGDEGTMILRAKLRQFFLAGERTVARLPPPQTWPPDPNRAVLDFLSAEFSTDLSARYVLWAAVVFVDDPSEANDWWEWRKVFARCANRAGWWDRLGLPSPLADKALEQFERMKEVNQDARDLADNARGRPESPWDRAATESMGLTAQSREYGEPFSAPLNTVAIHRFHRFWRWFQSELTPRRFDELHRQGLSLAQDLKIPPGSLVHPSLMRVPEI